MLIVVSPVPKKPPILPREESCPNQTDPIWSNSHDVRDTGPVGTKKTIQKDFNTV